MLQTQQELEQHLNEQIGFLENSVQEFDKGNRSHAKMIAVVLRTLLHDPSKPNPQSKSLLSQLGLKQKLFYDTSFEYEERSDMSSSFSGLVSVFVGENGGFVPLLDNIPPSLKNKKVKFNIYWGKEIFLDNFKNKFSRKELIHFVADQDGGAHVDAVLNRKYAALSRQNSLGWMEGAEGRFKAMKGAELVAIRQIAHEVLKTLVPNYKAPEPPKNKGFFVAGLNLVMEKESQPSDLNLSIISKTKIGRNAPCWCNSGKKFKKCHYPQMPTS